MPDDMALLTICYYVLNTLASGTNGHHFAGDKLKPNFMSEEIRNLPSKFRWLFLPEGSHFTHDISITSQIRYKKRS